MVNFNGFDDVGPFHFCSFSCFFFLLCILSVSYQFVYDHKNHQDCLADVAYCCTSYYIQFHLAHHMIVVILYLFIIQLIFFNKLINLILIFCSNYFCFFVNFLATRVHIFQNQLSSKGKFQILY